MDAVSGMVAVKAGGEGRRYRGGATSTLAPLRVGNAGRAPRTNLRNAAFLPRSCSTSSCSRSRSDPNTTFIFIYCLSSIPTLVFYATATTTDDRLR